MKMTKFFSLLATLVCAASLSAATLQSLVTNEHKNGDVIMVPNGTYDPSNLRTEMRKLTFRAESDGGVIIDGGNTARCVDLSDTITLEGFVLQNGKADRGGGVRGGTIIRTTIQNCSATFGGGSYQTRAYVSTYKANTAEFFGMAAYGGSAFSCRVEGNASATYGGGMGALFGVTVANTSVTGNTALHDNAGVLLSPAQNMVYFGNVAQRGLYEGAPMASANSLGSEDENAKFLADTDIFTNAAAGDYTLNVNVASSLIEDKGDSSLGDHYDELWYDVDLAGRPRLLDASIDLGPYEIADAFTVTCEVVGVGSATVSPSFIQEGDPVTLTAQQDANYAREFLGFYVNGELISTEASCTYNPVSTDKIEARFAGLSATTETLATVLTQLHPTIREEVTLADGAYTISGLMKPVAFVGASIGGTTVTLSDDCQGSFFINTTVTGSASNATLHRSLATNFSGSDLMLTSSIIASNCGEMSGAAVNVTAYTTMPTGLTCADCVTLNATTNTVAGAILPKGDVNIDAGQGNSGITPYDNLDIAGRPRVIGRAVDCGAHECHYITLTVEASGYYTSLTPAVGSYEVLTGDVMAFGGESPRTFEGWTLPNGTMVSANLNVDCVIPEVDVTMVATFAGFTMQPGDSVPEDTTAADTITLTAGTYNQDFDTAAKIVGTGKQRDVFLTGTIANATLEAVTLQGATLSGVTLNRCYVKGGTITGSAVYNSILVNVTSATGTYINNTTVNTTLSGTVKNTRSVAEESVDYTPSQEEADKGDSLTPEERNALGDYDYYGNPRVNNTSIDKGAVEYVWPPHRVTIDVIGHGLVEPRGVVEVVRGASLTFTVAEDPKHLRGDAVVENAEKISDGTYRVAPSADMTVTVTFPGLTVASGGDINAAIAEAQDGETITVAPGTYGAIDVKGKRLKIVASSSNPYDTIIDAQGAKRAVKLADGAEIIGFTIQNGLSNEGAGVYGGTVRRSVIRWNKLTYNGFGAGVCNTFAESCLIVDNGSTTVERSNGGGAANSELLNCTVVRNVADKGAGLYDCTAKNAVIALNVDLTGATSDWTGDSVEPDPADCCTPTTGGIAVDAATLFVDPANNDWRLREGVACVDKGATDDRLSSTDLTGAARVYGDDVDMGAIEWNAPDRKVKISLIGRGVATVSYTKNDATSTEEVMWGNTGVLSVPHGTDSLTLSWTEDAEATSVKRTLKGITADGVMIADSATAGTTDFSWILVTRDTVNVDLVFVAEELTVNSDDALTAALASAIPGETIHVAEGTYAAEVTVGAGVTLDGDKVATLTGGVTLADGALLKNVTVTTNTVVGPENGSATLLHSIVTEVDGVGIYRNVVVKTSLIHNNAGVGVMDATVYLSTIAANLGEGVSGASKVYGSIVWGNGADVNPSVTMVDSYVGGNPRFILPSPDGDNYALMSSSPAIDVAKTAQWEGFTDADRALTDLAGNPRPRLTGYDAGAYEVQATATLDNFWTWYGADYTMDGNIGDACWRQMAYGAPRTVPEGEDVRITDRTGYNTATLSVKSNSTFGNVTFANTNTDLRIADAGGTWDIESLANKTSAGALTLAAKMNIWSAFAQGGTGRLNIEPGAAVTIGGTFTIENTSAVTQTGGSLTVPSGNNTQMWNWSTYTIKDGAFNFGNDIYIHNNSSMVVEGGELTGNRISIAQQDGCTPLKIYGGNITVTRLETGDTSGARYGNVVQTGGIVNVTGSGSGKQAPLHISHWPGSSTYTLRGGELNVRNGEVRLGQDGNGTLRLEGGIARLKSVAISNGRVQLAGGTYEAPEAGVTLQATAVEGTTSTIKSYPDGDPARALTLELSGSGTVNLPEGSYRGTITGPHVMLGEKVLFYGTIDHSAGEKTLTLPGHTYANIQGTYKPGQIALSSEPPLGVRTAILGVTDFTATTNFTTADITLVGKWASCCTIEVVQNTSTQTAVYVTRTGNPTTEDGTPTITVDGDTTWSDTTKWSKPFEAWGDAVVNAVSSGTLNIDPSSQVIIGTLTFNVPEGVTLNVTATTMPAATTVKKTGLGTLKWSTLLNYSTFDEGEGSFIAAAAEQGFGGKAFETMVFRAEATCTLSGQTRVNVTLPSNGATLTLTPQGDILDGSITVESGGTYVYIYPGKTFTFVGDFVNNYGSYPCLSYPYGSAITLAGNTTLNNGGFYMGDDVRLAGNVKINSLSLASLPYQYFAPGLKTFDVGSLNLTMGTQLNFLNNQWPDDAMKVGTGTLTFPAGYTFGGSATFSGPVTFTESLVAPGSLHFKSDAVVTIPYGCTLTAADEIRVEPGARFLITNPPVDVDAEVTQSLLVSTKTAGLRVDQLASVSVVWGSAPSDTRLSNPVPSLNGDTLQYTIHISSVKTWSGQNENDPSNWSATGNWSGATYVDGDAVSFTSSPSQKTVTLTQPVSPSQMTIRSGAYTFTGGANLYAFEGKPDVTQYEDSGETAGATWQTFFTYGSYMLHAGATAKIALDDWSYRGTLSGSGALTIQEGRFALTAASNGFVGGVTVETGATLRLCNEYALYNGNITLKGALSVEEPASVATLTINGGTLSLATDAPLEVRKSMSNNPLSIVVTNIAEAGDWTILTYPASTSTTFNLVDTIAPGLGLKAALVRTETALILMVRSADNIEWTGTKTVDSVTTDVWKVNNLDVEVGATNDKHLFFNDVEDVAAATVAVPLLPRSLTVTAQNTYYTLTGSFADAPLTVEAGAKFTLATTSATPTAVKNEGVVTVTGTLDLTQATLSGYGQYIAGPGGVIRIGAQALAEATATFVRGEGQISVVVEGEISLPENRLPTADGLLIKEGAGTLYLPPATLTQPINIVAGTVTPTGGMALKARYLKFEAHERFAGSAWWLPTTGLSDFVTTLSGERQPWPEGTKIVRFDSGVTNKIQVGLTSDEQYEVSGTTGTFANVLDNNTETQLYWNDWHDSYGTGDKWARAYFVVDAGEAGVRFTGYNVGTPVDLTAFFWRWSVAMANDISDWHPTTSDSLPTANESTIWQALDDRTLPETTSSLTSRAWMTPAGYSVRRASGFWSNYSAPITIGAAGTLDLTKAIGTSGILQDEVEIASVTGDGTVIWPASLKVTADTFTVNTVNLVGTTLVRAPMTVTTAASFETVIVSDSVAAAFNSGVATQYVLVEGYTGTTIPMLQGMTSPADGGTWTLKLEDSKLKLVLEGSQREIYATLTDAETSWDELTWRDGQGEELDYIDWSKVQTVILKVTEESPDLMTVTIPAGGTMPTLSKVAIDYGQTEDKAVAVEGEGNLDAETLVLSGEYRSAFLPRSKTVVTCDTLEIALPKWDTSVPFIDALGGDNQYTPPAAEMGICANGEETLRTKLLGSNLMALRSGTLRLTREEQFGVMTRDFRVDAGATLDVNGCPLSNNLYLNGGTLSNTGNAIPSGKRQTYNITLTADSTVAGTSEHYSLAPGYEVHTLTLNGHTLTKRGSNTFIVHNANIEGGNGKIVVESGTLRIQPEGSQVRTMKNVELIADGGTLSITGVNTLQGRVVMNVGVVCTNNIELAENATLAGGARIDGNLTLNTGAAIEVTSAAAPLEVRGTISAAVTVRLANTVTTTAAVPLISMPNLASTVTFTVTDQPTGTELEWVNNILYLVPEGITSSVTEVKATVSGDTNWSALTWTDMNGAAVTPDWRVVTTATLTLTADAILTRDVASLALASLTLDASEYTLTLEGAALPSTLTTLAANASIVFGHGILSTIPTNLSGTKNLTFNSTVTSAVSGSETAFAYPNFTGNWIVESGATLNMNGGGGKFGVMNTTGEESGIITVKQGATINLNGGHAFGWADTAAQSNRTVLVVDGGHVEVGANNQYIRRTFEFKNGATMHAANNTIQQSRGGVIKVTEGEATFSGNFAFGCDSNGGSTNAQWVISEGACLNVPAVIQNGTNSHVYAVVISGGGTAVLSGANTYSLHETQVEANTTLLVNGTHRYAKPYTIRTNATFGGSGSLVSTSDNNCSVVFEDGAKLAIVNKDDPLSIQVGANANLTFNGSVSVTPPEGITMMAPAKLLVSNKELLVSNVSLTETEGYGLEVTQDSAGYTLYCTRVDKDNYPAIVADVSGVLAWDSIAWQTPEGTEIATDTINWLSVASITLRVTDNATVQIPNALLETATGLEVLNVVYTKANAVLTLAGDTVTLPKIHIASGNAGFLATSATTLNVPTLTTDMNTVGLDLSACNRITTLPENVTYSLMGDGTLSRALPGTTDVTIASNTLTMGAGNQLGGRRVIVKSGATLDLKGTIQPTAITLSGGTLTNTGAALESMGQIQTYGITLTADSTISGTAAITSLASNWNAHTLNLGGYTLTLTNSDTVYLVNTTLSNGTVVVSSGTLNLGDGNHGGAEATLNNVTIRTQNNATALFQRNYALTGTVVLDAGVKLRDGETLTGAEASLVLSANAFNGAATLTARNITLTATELPTRYPTVACTTLAVDDNYKALIAASEDARVQLATVSGDAPTVNNLPEGRVRLVDNNALYAAIAMSALKAEVAGEQTLAGLAWQNAETSETVAYANIVRDLITEMTLTVTADTQLALGDVKTLFPSLTTLNVVYGTANATLTLAGDAMTLPALSLSGEAGVLATTAASLAIDSLAVAQDTFTFEVNALNAVTAIRNLPADITLTGTGTLEKAMPAWTGTLTTNGTLTIASALDGTGAVTVAAGNTTLSGTNTYTGNTTIQSGATLVLTRVEALASSSTYKGAGTLSCDAFLPSSITSSLTANTWRGTVKIVGYAGSGNAGAAQLKLYEYGHANSVVEVENVTGWITSGSTIHNLKLTGTGLTFNNGSSNNDATITINHLFGSGSFNGATGNTWDYLVNIKNLTSADGESSFEGEINLSSAQSVDVAVVIGENATFENGKIVIAGNAKIASGKTWTATNGVKILEGATLSIAAPSAISSAFEGPGTLCLDATAGDLAFSGETAITLAELRAFTGVVQLKGEDENGVDLNFGTAVNGSMTSRLVVASGTHTMTYGQGGSHDFATGKSYETPALYVMDGATLDFTMKDLSGWSGDTLSGSVLRVAGDLTFKSNGSNTGYFRDVLYLDNGATVTIDKNGHTEYFCLFGGNAQDKAQFRMQAAGAATIAGDPIYLKSAAAADIGEGANLTIASVMALGNAFSKYGAGTLTLSAANTATGTLAINEGKLALTGTWAGPVTIAANSTLAGNGTVTGNLTLASHAIVDTSAGAPTVSGNVSLGDLLTVNVTTLPTAEAPVKVIAKTYAEAVETLPVDVTVAVNGNAIARQDGISYYLTQTTDGIYLALEERTGELASATVDAKTVTSWSAFLATLDEGKSVTNFTDVVIDFGAIEGDTAVPGTFTIDTVAAHTFRSLTIQGTNGGTVLIAEGASIEVATTTQVAANVATRIEGTIVGLGEITINEAATLAVTTAETLTVVANSGLLVIDADISTGSLPDYPGDVAFTNLEWTAQTMKLEQGTMAIRDGDRVYLNGGNQQRTQIPIEMTGGTLTLGKGEEAVWFGSANSTMTQSGGTVTMQSANTSTSGNNGLLFGWSGGSTYTLTGGMLDVSKSHINFWDTSTLNINGGEVKTLGIFDGGGDGAGTVNLTNGGQLTLMSAQGIPDVLSAFNVNGATIAATETTTIAEPIVLGGAMTLEGVAGKTLSISGVVSGTGDVAIASGTVALTATNTYTGATTVAAGATLAGNGTVPGALTFAAGAGLTMPAEGTLTVGGDVTIPATMTVNLTTAPTAETPVTLLTCTEGATLTVATSDFIQVYENGTLSHHAYEIVAVDNTIVLQIVENPVTAVKAEITGSEDWSALAWTALDGSAVSNINWNYIEEVQLSLASGTDYAWITRDVATPFMTSLTINAPEDGIYMTGTDITTLENLSVTGTLMVGCSMPVIPANLSGSGTLLFYTSTQSNVNAANDQFAYPNFTGRIKVGSGAVLTLAGVGDQKGQLNWDSTVEGSGQFEVMRGGKIVLANGHVFGWKDVAAQYDRTVFVVNGEGATLEIAEGGEEGTRNQYLRRTFELKDGATLNGRDWFNLARAGRLLVSSGTATLAGTAKMGCDGASDKTDLGARLEVAVGATLNVTGNIVTASSGHTTHALEIYGGGTVVMAGANTYQNNATHVAADTTLVVNGSHIPASGAGQAYTLVAGATLAGTGTIGPAVTFTEGAKLHVTNPETPLTINGQVTGTATLDGVTLPEDGVYVNVLKVMNTNSTVTFTTADGYQVAPHAIEGGVMYRLFKTPTYTALSATVTADSNWSALTWKDGETVVANPIWEAVTAVTLTAEANATVTIDTSLVTVTSLTVNGDMSLVGSDTLKLAATTVNVTNTGAGLTLNNCHAANKNISFTGSGTVTWATAGTHTGVITTVAGVTLKTTAETTLSSADNTLNGPLTVASGTLTLAANDCRLKGNVLVESGATLITTSRDTINYNGTQTITINGTVLVGAKWTIFNTNTIVLGASAVLDTYNNFAEPLDFFRANCPISVTGAGAVIRAVMFDHNGDTTHSAKITFAEGASLEIVGNVETIPVTTVLAEGATSATLKLTGMKTSTSTLTIGNGIMLAGDGTWSGPATFNGGKIQVANLEQPITIKGEVTASQPIEVAFDDETATVPVKVLASMTALTKDLLAMRVGYSRVVETPEGEPTTYILCYGEPNDADASVLSTTISEDCTWAGLMWTNVESGNGIDLEDVTPENITSITIDVAGDATLTLADVKTAFPNAVVTINYTTVGASLTLAGESVALPAITVTGKAGLLKSTATALAIDALSISTADFGVDVPLLNGVTTLTLPTAYNLFGTGAALTKALPATATVTLQSGVVKLGAANVLNIANTIIINSGATIDLNGRLHEASVTLNGGKLANTGAEQGTNLKQFCDVILTADSEIEVNAGHAYHFIKGGYATQNLTLNGHTLTKSGDGAMQMMNVSMDAGAVVVTGGSLDFHAGKEDQYADTERTMTNVTLFANGGAITVTRNYKISDTLTLKGDISISSVLSGDGALNVAAGTLTLSGANTYTGGTQIAEGAKVIATSIGTGEVTGAGDIELLINATAVSVPNIVKVAYTGAATLTASDDNGAIVENTNKVTWPSGKQYIFNGGTHALTFYPGALPNDKSTETEDSASIQVKANTTLTLKARDFGGWSGSHFNNIALSVKGENANVIAASFDSNPGCFVGRVYLADGATIQGGDNNTDAINFFGNADDANIHVTSGAASWTNKLWIGNGGGGDIINLGITVEDAASFDLSALVQNNKGIKKCGAGAMTLSGENTSTGSLIVNEGTAVITGAWAGATTMAVGTTLRGTGTVKGALTFTNTTETVEETTTITGWPIFEVGETALTVNGTITGVAQLSVSDDLLDMIQIPVVTSSQTLSADNFTNVPAGFELRVLGNTLYLVKQAAIHTTLYATVTTDADWSELIWTDAEGVTVEEIVWDLVEAVTLTAEADATVTRDVTTAALTALTVAASDNTLTMAGTSLDGATLTLNGDFAIAEATTLTTLTVLEGEGTLKLMAGVTVTVNHTSDNTSCLSGKKVDVAEGATLVLTANGNRKLEGDVDFSGITGTGKIVYQNNGWMTLPKAANLFAITLEVENNLTNGLILPEAGKAFQIGSLSGSGAFRVDFNGDDNNPRSLEIIQSKDTIYSGGMLTNNETGRISSFYLSGEHGATLTYTGTTTVAKPLVINASGSLNLTGTWTGEMTVAGKLAGSGTIQGAVTFEAGAVVVADGQPLTLGTVTSASTFVEVTATLDTVGAAATVFTATNDFDATKFSTSAAYQLEKASTTVNETTTYVLLVKRISSVTVTGTEAFNATTQQVLSDLVIDALKEGGVTSGAYAVKVEVHTQNRVNTTPESELVNALLGCFINVESVAIDAETNIATVAIDYEFGLADVTVDAKLNVIFKATVEGPDGTADYADGVSFVITDEATQETWTIQNQNVVPPEDEVGTVYLTLPDAYEVNGQTRSVLTNFIGTRKFRIRVKR